MPDLSNKIAARSGWRSTSLVCLLVLTAACVELASCATGPDDSPPVVNSQNKLDDGMLASMLEAHNHRVDLLRDLHATGSMDLRWADEDGAEHFEPGVDAWLWLRMPRRTALRARKLGEDVLWIGSDQERFWYFDLMNERPVLYLGRHEDAADAVGGSQLLLRPLALIDLLGLTALPMASAETAVMDTDRDAVAFDAVGQGGPMRLYLDMESGLPVRVETISEDSLEVVLFSELRRPVSVIVPGVSRAALPKMPTLIDISDPVGSVEVKLGLDEPSAEAEGEVWQRVFDLAYLRDRLRPDQVRQLEPDSP